MKTLVLVALADVDRAAHRHVQVRGRGLLVVGRLRRADEQRHQNVGLGLLDVLDGGSELRDAERDELLAHHRAALFLDDLADPLGRDLAEVVIGGDRVDLLAELIHHPGDQRRELLLRDGTRHDHMGVANAALVLVVVERQTVELVDDGPVGFTRGAREAGEHDVDLVLLQHAPHEFLVARVVRLRVVDIKVDLPPRDAAGLVDFIRGELNAMNLADRRDCEIARLVFKHAELDRIGGPRRHRQHQGRHRGPQHQ